MKQSQRKQIIVQALLGACFSRIVHKETFPVMPTHYGEYMGDDILQRI